MARKKISEQLRGKVAERAKFRCEYCQTTMEMSTQRFEIEHVQPNSKGGETRYENLALSCRGCNSHKFIKTKGFDKITQTTVSLFNPREDNWETHFAWDKDPLFLIGLTAIGRATIESLQLNRPQLISVRNLLRKAHLHPPL